MRPDDIRVPTRDSMIAAMREPGGRDRVRRLQVEMQNQRDTTDKRHREFTAQLEDYQQNVESVGRLRDRLDECLADLAEVLGEAQP